MPRIPRILRSRLPARYILRLAVLLYTAYCTTIGSPWFATALPPYTGPHDVGTIDIEAAFASPRTVGAATFKDTGEPAFRLETVLFSVFYPAEKDAKTKAPREKHPWLAKPVALKGEGYARFAKFSNRFSNALFTGALWGLARSLKIAAEVDVPILGATERALQGRSLDGLKQKDVVRMSDGDGARYQVVVFSHGMASSRTDYTHYCGELASRGYVVVAIEHRDGSCPGTAVLKRDGKARNMFHFSESQLQWPEAVDDAVAEIKKDQLAVRQAEVEEAIRLLKAIDQGHGDSIHDGNPREEGVTLAGWKGRLAVDQVVIAGHSYGATLALQALKDTPSKIRPIVGGIALDPGKQSGPLNDDMSVPVLVIHSHSWSKTHSVFLGRSHFHVVRDLVQAILDRGKAAWFMTCMGTSHPSVTDAPLIEPMLLSWTTGSTIDAKAGVDQYVQRSVEFLQYLHTRTRKGILSEDVTHPSYDQDRRAASRIKTMTEKYGMFWQIHVAPL